MVIKAARRSPTGAHGRELAGHQSTGSQRTLIRPDTRDTAAVPDFEFAVIEGRTSRAFTSQCAFRARLSSTLDFGQKQLKTWQRVSMREWAWAWGGDGDGR